jgi:hypothetical protein
MQETYRIATPCLSTALDASHTAITTADDDEASRREFVDVAPCQRRERPRVRCYADVEACFRRRGAYAPFKDLLDEERFLEVWYAFETESTRRALCEWCEANGIELVTDDPEQAS